MSGTHPTRGPRRTTLEGPAAPWPRFRPREPPAFLSTYCILANRAPPTGSGPRTAPWRGPFYQLAASGDVFFFGTGAGQAELMVWDSASHTLCCKVGFLVCGLFPRRLYRQCVCIAQPCLTLCDPVDCSLPGSSVHGISQARALEWTAIPFLQSIFPTQGSKPDLPHCGQIFCHVSQQGSP